MWICDRCKIKNYDNYDFCPACGEPRREKQRKTYLVLAIALSMVLFAGTGAVFLTMEKTEPSPPPIVTVYPETTASVLADHKVIEPDYVLLGEVRGEDIRITSTEKTSDESGSTIRLHYNGRSQDFSFPWFSRYSRSDIQRMDLDRDGDDELVWHCPFIGGSGTYMETLAVFEMKSDGSYSCVTLDTSLLEMMMRQACGAGKLNEEYALLRLEPPGKMYFYRAPIIGAVSRQARYSLEDGKITLKTSANFKKTAPGVYDYVCWFGWEEHDTWERNGELLIMDTVIYSEIGYDGSDFYIIDINTPAPRYDIVQAGLA